MFPSIESAGRRFAFLHRVLRGEFPCFHGTIKALRLPAARPAALRYLRLAVPRLHSLFSLLGGRVRRQGLELVTRYLRPGCCRGNDRISQVPGEPQFPFAHVLRPRPADAFLTLTECSRGPRSGNDEDADDVSLSRLNSMAFGLAAYVSRDGCPPNRARLASRCWSGSPGRAFTRRAPTKGFQLTSCALASFPKLLGTIPGTPPELRRPRREAKSTP